ncbi:hypothetical protein NDU88_001974 [Pleurodeles waltl]|uniref:Uncharacterized protein n=1 Tax=Pleurodeles waltl TaxID=8319 RepID=A0AAV7NGN7_PLEWA|nr:hypothetical protein NDU88_001974 [Pleurodeles waltl]
MVSSNKSELLNKTSSLDRSKMVDPSHSEIFSLYWTWSTRDSGAETVVSVGEAYLGPASGWDSMTGKLFPKDRHALEKKPEGAGHGRKTSESMEMGGITGTAEETRRTGQDCGVDPENKDLLSPEEERQGEKSEERDSQGTEEVEMCDRRVEQSRITRKMLTPATTHREL